MIKRILLAPLLLVAAVYACDYIGLRIRIARNRQPFGTVQVRRYYAVPMKNSSTEYMFEPPAPQTCVNSLFPHFGYTPCWYLKRHARQEINVGGAEPSRY